MEAYETAKAQHAHTVHIPADQKYGRGQDKKGSPLAVVQKSIADKVDDLAKKLEDHDKWVQFVQQQVSTTQHGIATELSSQVQQAARSLVALVAEHTKTVHKMVMDQRRLTSQNVRRSTQTFSSQQSQPLFRAGRGAELTWEEAMEQAVPMTDTAQYGGLLRNTRTELNVNTMVHTIMETFPVLPFRQLQAVLKMPYIPKQVHKHVMQLLDTYPLLAVQNVAPGHGSEYMIINISTMDVSCVIEDEDEAEEEAEEQEGDGMTQKQTGRRRIEEVYPDLVPLIQDLVAGRGENEAQRRRQDDRISSVGITLGEMVKEAEQRNIEVSRDAI